MTLRAPDFAAWMKAVHGQEPFPWQRRLLEQVLAEGWPRTLRLPTSVGKTTALDVALFALAVEAVRRPAERRMPLRIALVVDRRIVVDGAFERAGRIRDAVVAAQPGVVAQVAEALGSFGAEVPLHVALLRGGIYREDRWARQPNQPTILCSTVDQVGSRLLHRGYGVSPSTWPIHAGLLGNDTLILLDEAHCSEPFRQTLAAIERCRGERFGPWHVTTMTATPKDAARPFELDDDDRAHPLLKRRLDRPKPMKLLSARSLSDAVVEEVKGCAAPGKTILVVVNRVAAARELHAALESASSRKGPAVAALLLTGRSRGVERDALLDAAKARLLAGRARDEHAAERCLVVVATQCVEVGADLDADLLITEACPLDALRQRLGRLNRLGELAQAPCVVVARQEHAWDGAGEPPEDAVYGPALARAWRWLRDQEKDGALDGGVEAFGARCEDAARELSTASPDAPFIFPAYCDLWAQTGPAPASSPEPAPFLHGPSSDPADVQLVWRADLDDEDTEEQWLEIVSLCPPVAGETLALRPHVARAWLAGALERDDSGDVEGQTAPEERPPRAPRSVRFVRWHGADRSEVSGDPDEVMPGDTLVLPARRGGCDRFGWHPASPEPVADLADAARVAARRAPVLRLHPACTAGAPEVVRTLAARRFTELPDDVGDLVKDALDALSPGEAPAARLARSLLDPRSHRRVELHPSGTGLVVLGRAAHDFTDEDDTSSSGHTKVGLQDHLDDVRALVERYAAAVGLPAAVAADLARAASLHDLGKVDPRFQAWLRDGSLMAALRDKEMLAKSERMPPNRAALRASRERAGYPEGGRHELLSVRLVEHGEALLEGVHDRDLVLHLIESHHGHCRPFAPAVHDPAPLDVTFTHEGVELRAPAATRLEQLDSGVAERFFRLLRRYGWWGLSYLETCLRLADHRASEAAVEGRTR